MGPATSDARLRETLEPPPHRIPAWPPGRAWDGSCDSQCHRQLHPALKESQFTAAAGHAAIGQHCQHCQHCQCRMQPSTYPALAAAAAMRNASQRDSAAL
jgi:hypothetical protein